MISVMERDRIELETRGQAENPKWFLERQTRVTASTFGQICKSRNPQRTAQQIGKAKPVYTKATVYGRKNEQRAIEAYERLTQNKVHPCGLFVDLEYPFIAGTPDGVIPEKKIIVECKCPYSARGYTPKEAEEKLKNFCMLDGKLKRNHNYYYQLQGALYRPRELYYQGF